MTTAAETAADIARLTAELRDLERRYPSTTAQSGLVLVKRMVRIRRKLRVLGWLQTA